MSELKIEATVEMVEALIASQFPEWANLPIAPVEQQGWDNRTFRLGLNLSVRLPSAEGYTPQAQKEQQWLPVLAPHLPLLVPTLRAKGTASEHFPWQWGVYEWIEGGTAKTEPVDDFEVLAEQLANFLNKLQQIDTTNAPLAGQHSFFRGASLMNYHEETLKSIDFLKERIDATEARHIWENAVSMPYNAPPVWFHGDIAAGNLLIKNGQLQAVIDFGCCGVGDPACDLAIAWTLLFGKSREKFRNALNTDEGTWARGQAWALWKALITFRDGILNQQPEKMQEAQKVLEALSV
jgi:aminoglycoside phosphotransferase (APT) family kinase protein